MFFALFFSGGKVKHRVFLILSLLLEITSRVGPREQVVRPVCVCVWCVVVLSKEEEEEEKKKKEN
jgi:hypothetical protein